MILLTPEETNKSYEDGIVAWGIAENPQYDDETYAYLAIAKAQAKKIADWGKGMCPHLNKIWFSKRGCPQCWDELEQEIK